MSLRSEVRAYVESWADKTEMMLQDKLSSWKIRHTDALYQSVRMHVYQQAEDIIGVSLQFATYGRFVDMGVGRGRGQAQLTQAKYRARLLPEKKRKPRMWYSRTYFARVRQLDDVLSLKLVEQAIVTIVHNNQGFEIDIS